MGSGELSQSLGKDLAAHRRSRQSGATSLFPTHRLASLLLICCLFNTSYAWEGQIKFADYGILVSPVEYEHVSWDIDFDQLSQQAEEFAGDLESQVNHLLKNSTWSKGLQSRFRHQIGPLISALRQAGHRIKALVKTLRDKRSLGVILAIGASIAAVGSSIYTIDKVHGLEGELRTSRLQIELNRKNLV